MSIDPKRLRELRSRKGWSQKVLASHVGVNEQTIYKAEKTGWPNPRPEKLANLAKALGVSAEVLAGTAPLPARSDAEEDRDLEKWYPTLRLRVSPETRNAYSLVALRYGVSERKIANLAPVLFSIIAEQSLRQRSSALKELEASAATLESALDRAATPLPHLGLREWLSYDSNQMIAAERRSIQERDISARQTLSAIPNGEDLPMDPEDGHSSPDPFSMFVRDAAQDVGLGIARWPQDDEPVRINLGNEVKQLAGGDADLAQALGEGWILIRDIPAELRQPQRSAERVAWLRERLTNDEYAREKKIEWDQTFGLLEEILPPNAPASDPDA